MYKPCPQCYLGGVCDRAFHILCGVLWRVLLRVLSLECTVSLSVFSFLLRFGLVIAGATCVSMSVGERVGSSCVIVSPYGLLLCVPFDRSGESSRSMFSVWGRAGGCFSVPCYLWLCALHLPRQGVSASFRLLAMTFDTSCVVVFVEYRSTLL